MNEAWIETVSGEKFYLFYPEHSNILIGDIAHALSHLCRYNGHTSHFYSVAEHSVHVSDYLAERYSQSVALVGLLHDAAEAYIGDIVSPLKANLPGLKELEAKIENEIFKRLCPIVYSAYKGYSLLVKTVDTNIVNDERQALMSNSRHIWEFAGREPLKWPIPCWSSEKAAAIFHNRFTKLSGQIEDQYKNKTVNA